jgi:hypothetical protein
VHQGITASAFPSRPAKRRTTTPRTRRTRHPSAPRATAGSPGSRAWRSACVPGISDRAGSASGSRKRRWRCCLPPMGRTSAPRTSMRFRGSIAPPTRPLSTLRCALTERQRMTRGHRGSLLLRCRELSSPSPCRFIPALSPITIMSPARRRAGSRTEISMGARAHQTPHSASSAPVKRYALGPQGRPARDRAPPLALTLQSRFRGRPGSPNRRTTTRPRRLTPGPLHR